VRGLPFSELSALAGVDCALEDQDQRLAIWSFGHSGSWYMRSWRIPLQRFERDDRGLALLAQSARPFPPSAYAPVPYDWWQRWIQKRDGIMSDGKPGRDWVRLQAVYTNAAPLREAPAAAAAKALLSPLVIPIARYDSVSSPFGVTRYITATNGAVHRGIDFASPEGVPVRAPWPGRVVFADETHTSGNMVILHHGWGIYSSFMHLSAFRTKPDLVLQAGETLGLVGTTGLSTGPHLHYELRAGNSAIDPTPCFARSPFADPLVWKDLPH